MTHQFQVHATVRAVNEQQFKQLIAQPSLHEMVCRRVSGESVEILKSELQGNHYTLHRAYAVEVNLPEVAKKFLKDAFRVERHEVTDIENLTSVLNVKANFPVHAEGKRRVMLEGDHLHVVVDWKVDIKVPFLGGMLEKHAEHEIRRLSALEISVIEDEMQKRL